MSREHCGAVAASSSNPSVRWAALGFLLPRQLDRSTRCDFFYHCGAKPARLALRWSNDGWVKTKEGAPVTKNENVGGPAAAIYAVIVPKAYFLVDSHAILLRTLIKIRTQKKARKILFIPLVVLLSPTTTSHI